MTTNVGVLIVEKAGILKPLCVKIYKETELYKRCGFKSDVNFQKRGEWYINRDDKCYTIYAYGKDVGRLGFENNYSFPPPLNTPSLFGNCVLVLHVERNSNPGTSIVETLTVDFWNSIATEMEHVNNTKNGATISDTEGSTDIGYLQNDDLEEDNTVTIPTSNGSLSDDDSNASELVEEEYILE